MNDFQKAWRTIVQDHVNGLHENVAPWKQNIEK